jgi:hypothetical protein
LNLSEKYPIDLQRLLETRLLIQANSGGGKSHALRRLLEQTAPHVQQLVIDPEGEFATLREKFDYVIAAPHDADAIASPHTATLLARRLLEAGVSAVLDIYDLKAHERHLFVRRFLDALINAPRALWHPVLIVLDEAHVYCPQTGSSEAASAVIDIATRGRKRGLCLVAATQRLSKLHKDCAAELLNKLIGRTGLDVDVQRAGDELGMTKRDATAALRDLEPGEFFGFGPALSRGVEKILVGEVLTTHPTSGHRLMLAPPPASDQLRKQLAKLTDLQKEAEQEARTFEEIQAANADLRRKLAAAEKRAAKPESVIARPIATLTATELSKPLRKALEQMVSLATSALNNESGPAAAVTSLSIDRKVITRPLINQPIQIADGISSSQQKILDVLAQLELFGLDAPDKKMIAAHAGCSPTSGGYFNNLGKLRTLGLIDYPMAGTAALTVAGKQVANYPKRAPSLEELHESWLRIVSGSQREILSALLSIYPDSISKNDLADQVGASRTSGGYFNNLGKLRTLGAIDYPSKGAVIASLILFRE